eukprot:EG_transcript_45803
MYHANRGLSMNVGHLCADLDVVLNLPQDDPSFFHLFEARREGLWNNDLMSRRLHLLARPIRCFDSIRGITESLRCGGSNATSLDSLPIAVLQHLTLAGMVALSHYVFLLRGLPKALSNEVIQLAIPKGGPQHL